jgi:hypothetical protein
VVGDTYSEGAHVSAASLSLPALDLQEVRGTQCLGGTGAEAGKLTP